MVKRKIALFGGTFDPIHLGHTTVASAASEKIGAEKTIFIPAKHSALKVSLPVAREKQRLEMIALAITGNKAFDLSDYELRKAGPSYTLETVRHFQADFGSDTSICWLIGADTVAELVYWHGIVELIDKCILCAMYRAGCEKPDFTRFEKIWSAERVEKLQSNIIETPLIDISSSEIRSRIRASEDISDMVCPAVTKYIKEHGLYL